MSPRHRHMIVPIRTKLCKQPLQCDFAHYGNGRIALELNDPMTGEPFFRATVNVVAYDLPEGMTHLKGWNENEGVPEALQSAGLVELTGETVQTGWVEAHLAKWTPMAMEEYTKQKEDAEHDDQ